MPIIDSSPRTVRLVTAVVLVATFAAGTITGAGLVHWFGEHPGPPQDLAPPLLPWDELNLSDQQQQKVHEIFERYRPELDEVLNAAFPKVRAINERIEQDVRQILTEGQRRILEQANARRHAGPPMRPPPPPHGRWPDGVARGPRPGPPPPPGLPPDGGMLLPPGVPPPRDVPPPARTP